MRRIITPELRTGLMIYAPLVLKILNYRLIFSFWVPYCVKQEAFRSFNKDVPLLVQANARIPKIENGKTVFPETPDEMARSVPGLIDAGVSIIGGFCGTTPDHITAIMNKAKV